MYHTLSINDLSKKQVSKLLNAHPVRVKMGSGAKIHVTADQAKKMNKAGLKGCAITLTLDPYAIEHNQHLRDAVGMLRKAGVLKGKDGGKLLIDQPFTVRQAVNSTGKFFKDPKGTIGFGFEGPLPSPDRGKPQLPFKRGRGSMKGDGFFEDIGKIAKSAGKTIIKQLANEVVEFAGPASGAAFAAAATAAGQPQYAPAAAILGNELGSRGGRYANSKIQGMGGRLLIDEPLTTRQIVNTTGNFLKNPAKTLGFGAKRKKKGKGFVEELAKIGNKMMPVLEALKPQYNDMGVGDAVAKSVGLGVKKPKRVMSEAQKSALAKGRHALRIKLNEMGAGVKKRKSGTALLPAGYKSGMALMQAGY